MYMGEATMVKAMKSSSGIRGLCLMACGTAMTQDDHFQSVKSMVDKYVYSILSCKNMGHE